MSRIDELKLQLAQLDGLIRSGVLTPKAAGGARERLQQELLSAADPSSQQPRPSGRLVIGLVSFLLVFSAAGYAWLGNRAGLSVSPGSAVAANPAETVGAAQIEAMIDRLAQRLKTTPDDVEGWAMLGRSYSVLGRHAEAASAYRKVTTLRPNDAQGYVDLADAIASGAGNNLGGEPERLLARALTLDPNNVKALALSGALAFGHGDGVTATKHWERALGNAEPGGDMAIQLQGALKDARLLAGPAAAPGAAAPSTGAATVGESAAVQGRVTLAAKLKTLTSPEDTVFIFARPVQGSKAPLAVLRKQVKDLPLEFTLDDSLAMSPAMRLSTASKVQVGARISKSGNPMPQPGDLQGLTATVAVGARGITLEISEAVK